MPRPFSIGSLLALPVVPLLVPMLVPLPVPTLTSSSLLGSLPVPTFASSFVLVLALAAVPVFVGGLVLIFRAQLLTWVGGTGILPVVVAGYLSLSWCNVRHTR